MESRRGYDPIAPISYYYHEVLVNNVAHQTCLIFVESVMRYGISSESGRCHSHFSISTLIPMLLSSACFCGEFRHNLYIEIGRRIITNFALQKEVHESFVAILVW